MGIGIHIIGLVLERPIRKLRAALLPDAVERTLRGADDCAENAHRSTNQDPHRIAQPSVRDNGAAVTARSSRNCATTSELTR
jgi:hypothetical protein